MEIRGINLGKMDVEYNGLSFYDWTDDEMKKKLILNLENMYKKFLNSKDNDISSFPIDDNGKVIIKPGMLNHRCVGNLDMLSNISKYGVLASEWFGILESDREGCFCTFISRMKSDDYRAKGDLAEDNYSRLNIGDGVVLFFDDNNPIMKYLLHLDFFEYEYLKGTNKENLLNMYTPDEILLFDNLIEPLSPSGKDMRVNYEFKTNYWSAIPGGIPPFLINGICIKKCKYSDKELDKISELFPNAVIFNNNLDIVRYPLINNDISQTKKR